MKTHNIIKCIKNGASIMLILDDSETVIMCETPEKAADYVTDLRENGLYEGKICVLSVKIILP